MKFGLGLIALLLMASMSYAITACGSEFTANSTLIYHNEIEDTFTYALHIQLNSSMVDNSSDYNGFCFVLLNSSGSYPLNYTIEPQEINRSGETPAFINLTIAGHADYTIIVYSGNTTVNPYGNNPYGVFMLYDNFTALTANFTQFSGTWTSPNGYGLTETEGSDRILHTANQYSTNLSARWIFSRADAPATYSGYFLSFDVSGSGGGAYGGYLHHTSTNISAYDGSWHTIMPEPHNEMRAFELGRSDTTAYILLPNGTVNATYAGQSAAAAYATVSGGTPPSGINITYFALRPFRTPEPTLVYANAYVSTGGAIVVNINNPLNASYLNTTIQAEFNITGGSSTYFVWRTLDGVETQLANASNNTPTFTNLTNLAVGGHILNITAGNGTVNATIGRIFAVSNYNQSSNSSALIAYETTAANYTFGLQAVDIATNVSASVVFNDSVSVVMSCANTAGHIFNCTASRNMPLAIVNASIINHTITFNITLSNGSRLTGSLAPFSQAIVWAYIPVSVSLATSAYYSGEIVLINGTVFDYATAANRSLWFTLNNTLPRNSTYIGASTYQVNYTLPNVSVNTTYGVIAYYNITYNGVNAIRNTSATDITVLVLNATNCSVGGFPVLIYLLRDEENASAINGTQEITLTLYNPTRTSQFNVSLSNYSSDTLSVCLPSNNPLLADSVHIYYAPEYTTRYHYLINASLNPAAGVQTIPLYLLNTTVSTPVQFSVENQNGQNEGGVYIVAQRYYPAENVYRAVAMGKTNDNGDATIYLRILSPTYRYLVYKNFALAKTTASVPIGCTVSPCSITIVLGTGEISEYLTWSNTIGHACSYDNTTFILNCTFADSTQVARNFRLLVEESTALKHRTICDVSVNTQAGSLSCSGLNASTRYVYSLTFTSSPLNILEGGVIVQHFLRDLGAFGRFLGLLVFIAIVGIGILIPDAFTGGIFAGVGLFVLMVLNLVPFSETTIAGLVLFAVILAMKGASSKGG